MHVNKILLILGHVLLLADSQEKNFYHDKIKINDIIINYWTNGHVIDDRDIWES
jgi:hypothetical protein